MACIGTANVRTAGSLVSWDQEHGHDTLDTAGRGVRPWELWAMGKAAHADRIFAFCVSFHQHLQRAFVVGVARIPNQWGL